MKRYLRSSEYRFKLAALVIMTATTIALFAFGQTATAVISVLTNLGLAVNSLWVAPRDRATAGELRGGNKT